MSGAWFEFVGENHSKEFYDKLSKEEKEILNKWKSKILANASEERAREGLRELLRFRAVVGKSLNNISNKETEYFSKQLRDCKFSGNTKNKILAYVRQFLKIQYKDHEERFDNFEYLRFIKEPERKEDKILTQEEVKKMLNCEDSLFWKTFLILQWEGALRTKEARQLKWKEISIEGDGFTNINPHSRKNPDGSDKFRAIPLKESTSYLTELKKQQKEKHIESIWVFPSPMNPKNHISKSVNDWFNKLSKKALGKVVNPYLLRHSRLTELNKLVNNNLLSKDLALKFAGHSQEMFDKIYNHTTKEEVKNMLKKQIYDIGYLPEEKKHKLEAEIEALNKVTENQETQIEALMKGLDFLLKHVEFENGKNPTFEEKKESFIEFIKIPKK